MYPSLKDFKKLSREFDRVTVYKEANGDMETPVSMLSKLLTFETAILLESAKQDKTYSRFSFLAFDIREKLVFTRDGFYKHGQFLEPALQVAQPLLHTKVPSLGKFGDFSGGYVGNLNYEFVGACGILKTPLLKEHQILGTLYLVEKFLVYDNYTNGIYLAVSSPVGDGDPEHRYQEIADELDQMEEMIKNLTPSQGQPQDPAIRRWIPRALFVDKVRKIRGMIEEGEAIQIVLSDFLEADHIDPFEFYRNLRRINPSPYMYFLKDGDTSIVGSSPEIHLRIRDRVATLKPIAGTKPRRPSVDLKETIHSLIIDEKEKAEHLMLVDLARNDLSRICKVKSVAVKSFMQPEVYSHVVHLVSEVEGQLLDDIDALEAVKQTFPAGTVSGAPKVRAMEIIDEMEEHPRGAYAGCIGYIGFNGNVDMAITIRTGLFNGPRARLQAGAGIVYDSAPEREYDEVMNKLLVLLKAGRLA